MAEDAALLTVRGLRKRFGGADLDALSEIDFDLQRGSILGLVGPDGAGKTTLIRLVAGLFSATEGEIRVAGCDPARENDLVRAIVGYMPQKFGLYEDLSVMENLTLSADLRGLVGGRRRDLFKQLLGFTGLGRFQSRRAGALSGGMKQKLGLACALLSRPKVLLLDEPSVGVDPVSRRELWRMVKDLSGEGIGVIWSTAYLDEAELCEVVLLLNEGKMLFSGHPGELTDRVKGRTFALGDMRSGRRKLLSRLLGHHAISDAVIEGSCVRVVLRESEEIESIRGIVPEGIRAGETKARFEDAFIDLLGGGPDRASILADRVKEVEGDGSIPMVEAQGLTKKFGDFFATRGIDFAIERGEIFGLLGPNGAGKSTTFKMMCGLLRPTSGDALVKGMNLQKAGGRARQRIGYMAQKFSLYGNLSVKQNLDFFSGAYGLHGQRQRDRIELMVELFGLRRFLSATPESLSLGFKQRLALSCALMHDPEILFLDEPTSGVDPVTRREFWSHIYGLTSRGVTVMVTTHFMDEAEYCDRIGLIHGGELIALGLPADLKELAATPERKRPTMEETFIRLIRRHEEKKEAA